MYNLLAALSTGAAANTTRETGAGAGIGTAISPSAGFGFHGVPFNVVKNSKSHRSNSGRLQSFLILYTPLGVTISISSLRSLIPMNAPSCHVGSNFACPAPPGRIVICGTARQHAVREHCARQDQLDTFTSTFPRAPRRTPGLDAVKVPQTPRSLSSNELFITLTCFCHSRTVTSMVPFD